MRVSNRSGVPQGTKLGPWLFILMINDLKPHQEDRQQTDDTSISEVVPKTSTSNIQIAVDYVPGWSTDNRLHLNDPKCKVLLINFNHVENSFQRVMVKGNELELVSHAKILELVVNCDLKWNEHVFYIIKKTNKRIYFVLQLNRAKVAASDIVMFYSTCIDLFQSIVARFFTMVYHNIFHLQSSVFKSACYQLYTLVLGATLIVYKSAVLIHCIIHCV